MANQYRDWRRDERSRGVSREPYERDHHEGTGRYRDEYRSDEYRDVDEQRAGRDRGDYRPDPDRERYREPEGDRSNRGAGLWRNEFGSRSVGPDFDPDDRDRFMVEDWRGAGSGYFGTDGGPDIGRAYQTGRSRGYLERSRARAEREFSNRDIGDDSVNSGRDAYGNRRYGWPQSGGPRGGSQTYDLAPEFNPRNYGRTPRNIYGEGEEGRFSRFSGDRGYGTHRGKGPKGYERSDERVKEAVSEQLSDDPNIDASEITVNVANGIARLSGFVSSRAEKYEVEEIVANCSGVKDVENQLRIQTGQQSESSTYPTSTTAIGSTPGTGGKH